MEEVVKKGKTKQKVAGSRPVLENPFPSPISPPSCEGSASPLKTNIRNHSKSSMNNYPVLKPISLFDYFITHFGMGERRRLTFCTPRTTA